MLPINIYNAAVSLGNSYEGEDEAVENSANIEMAFFFSKKQTFVDSSVALTLQYQPGLLGSLTGASSTGVAKMWPAIHIVTTMIWGAENNIVFPINEWKQCR